jgi:hypothetical protein
MSAMISPPLPVGAKKTLAVPPERTSMVPLPISTNPPLTTVPLRISTRLLAPLANSVPPQLFMAPCTSAVPLANVSTRAPPAMVTEAPTRRR